MPSGSQESSIWAIGRKYAIWVAILTLFAIPLANLAIADGIPFSGRSFPEVVVLTILGMGSNYIITILLVASITWATRTKKLGLVLFSFMVITAITFFIIWNLQNPEGFFHTPSLEPQVRPDISNEEPSNEFGISETARVNELYELWDHCLLGKSITIVYFNSLFGQKSCIYGIITTRTETELGNTYINIFPSGETINFIVGIPNRSIDPDDPVWGRFMSTFPTASATADPETLELGLRTNADAGECIVAIGYPMLVDDRPFFVASDVRDISQISSMLGIDSPIVQQILTFCK